VKLALALLAGLVAVAVIVALGSPAHAYVRTTTVHDDASIPTVPVRWNVSCLVMQPDARGSQDVPMADVQSALQRSIDAWTVRTGPCGGLTLSMTDPKGNLEVGDDGHQALIFRNVTWQRPGHPPYDPSAIALTTVMYVDSPGQIGDGTLTDADIEVNNVDYTFTIDPNASTARDGTILVNLINTLTHELGHVQGLAHTCWDHISATAPIDNLGNPILDCNDPDLPASIIATIMYPFYVPSDPSARPLTSDDVSGVCDVYSPLAGKLGCYLDITGGYGGGCSAAPQESPAPGRRDRSLPIAALMTLALLLARAARLARR
jgi:hypothetical protein